MKTKVNAGVTVSLSISDIERLMEDGEISDGDVTIEVFK
jgi:hypothetical protein